MSPDTKTPEMNELESDKQNLKSGAPNFEKQKNESSLIGNRGKKLFSCFRKAEVAFFKCETTVPESVRMLNVRV